MVKKIPLLPLILAFFVTAPCFGMQMAAQQAAQSIQTLDEAAAKELIHQLLAKKYKDMADELSKLSKENKELVKGVLHKNFPLSTVRVHLQQVLSDHIYIVTAVTFSNDGHFALTGSCDTTARLWDLTKSPITSQELIGHSRAITSVAFSPDRQFALTASFDKTVRLWDLTKSPITSQELKGHTDWVKSVAVSPNGRFALTGSDDRTVRLWDLTKSPITSQELVGHTSWVTSVAFSPNGHYALTGSLDKTALLWDLSKSPFTSQLLMDHTDEINSVAFSPCGRFALIGSGNKIAYLLDLTKTPHTSKKLIGHTSSIKSVAFSPSGTLALTAACDETALLWDLTKSPITSQELKGHTEWVESVAFSPDSSLALTGSVDTTARLWKIESIDLKVLSVDDSLLILKLIENEDSLKNDSPALERLHAITKENKYQPHIINLITDYLYRTKLPAQACCICTEKYDTGEHICMQLPCCKQSICKACLDRIGNMTYSAQFESYQFEHTVQKKCPYCNRPANQMGIIKKYDTNTNAN